MSTHNSVFNCAAAADSAVQDIKNSYRVALERGLPLPIIYTLEFFNVDDGGFIWQRAIRSAGHFTYIIFWSVCLCVDITCTFTVSSQTVEENLGYNNQTNQLAITLLM